MIRQPKIPSKMKIQLIKIDNVIDPFNYNATLNFYAGFKYKSSYQYLRYFGMFTSLQRYIPLFEAYLLADNKADFLSNRNDPTEKSLLQIFTSPITSIETFQEKMKKISIDKTIQQALLDYKLFSYVQNAKELPADLLFKELKERYCQSHFEYARPATLNTEEPKKGEEKSSESSIALPATLREYLQNKRKTNPQTIRYINDYAFSKLSEATLHHLSLSDKEYVLDTFATIFHMDTAFLTKFLIDFEQQKRKTNDAYRLPNKILSCLTKKQLLAFGKAHHSALTNEDYVELWFNQLYAETIRKHVENSNLFTKEEQKSKRQAFLKIVNELKEHEQNPIIKRYLNKLRSEILVLDTITNDPHFGRLTDYLSTSQVGLQLQNLQSHYQDELRRNQRQLVQEPRMRYRLQVDKTSPNVFIEEYIELLFKHNPKESDEFIKKLSRFFEEKYLRKLNAKVKLYRGEVVDNASYYFNQQELQGMKDRKQIRILPSNPKKYKVEDDVKLDVTIKNVKKIQIKVYTLNLKKHLLGESSNLLIDDQIQLSFLNPTAQHEYVNTSSNPFEIFHSQIDLSSIIPKAMGVYIVDFQGETVTSRAVIRKGTIICVDTFTEAGQQFSFFDQNGRPLAEKDGLKVWINGQITSLTDNKAFVSYREKKEYGTIVAVIGDYAESFQKRLQEQKYKFEVGYIYNTESFIVGRKAKIIVHGRLSMNNKTMSLQLLKNTKITATVTNNQDIKTSFPVQIQKWNNSEDQVIEFPIQAYTKQINITVESQITLQTKKDISLSSSKDIEIDLGESSTNFLDLYLEQDHKENYILTLLGANGEPITNADVILSFYITGVNEVERKQLKTNSQGQINLGSLSIVSKVSAEVNNSESKIQRNWTIDQTENNFNYNNTIHFKLGQPFTLPVSRKWTKGDVLFLRTFDKFYSEDLTDQLHIQNGKVSFPTINEEGFYIVKLLPIDKTIEIITLKNIKWQDDNIQNQKVYDEAEGTVYQINKNIYQTLAVQGAAFNLKETHIQANLTLNLGDLPEDRLQQVRVHVLANNFLGADVRDVFNTDNFNLQGQLGEHFIQTKRSAYYNNKTFSEEGAYVWNRQSKNEALIGNNLEKPSIFLKRALIRETSQNNEELYDQGRYVEECAMMDVDPNLRERFKARNNSGSKIQNASNSLNLNSHNNFLLISGDLSKNLHGKSLNFELPLGYNSIEVYVLTPKTALKYTYSIGLNQPHQKKDLRHIGLERTEENVGWTMSREIYQLNAGDKKAVSRDSQWRTVGLADIFQFASNKRIRLYDWSNHLLNWNSYNDEKKRQIYDKECCHELNTFIKFKDPKFFESVVSGFIRNKIQKTVVDILLLNDPSYIKYIALNELNNLNAFEKALLVYTLVKNNQTDTATSITQSAELYQKSITKNYQQYKTNFDTIINAKAQEERAGKILQSKRARDLQDMKKCRSKGMKREQRQEKDSQSRNMRRMMDMRMQRMVEKKAFVPVESTKQYTEQTYYNVKNYKIEAPRIVPTSRFWAELSRNFLNNKTEFISDAFMYLRTPIEFILASTFIPSESSSNYEISNSGQNYEIQPQTSMLLFVKEVKKVEHQKKFGVLINQRFFDPNNRKAYEEDGTEYEKEVEQFVIKKCYICQTVINNTSGTPLELQVLLDIPRGTIPLKSHEYTQIININIPPYTSQSFERLFYIPQEGEYEIYPSNASRGSTIIAKAIPLPPISVKKTWTINKLESLEDILRSGDKTKVLSFLQEKNIFDSKIFRANDIYWMLKDKEFYQNVIKILRKRNYYEATVWSFAFLHHDHEAIKEIMTERSADGPSILSPVSFEYFPYYSSRTHQFANESKSTIRNVQFKQTYLRFLVGSIVGLKQESFEVSYSYYLILQDRLREASQIINKLTEQQYRDHQIQFDYMKCFLNLSLNAPNFTIAREIAKKYDKYPVESWKKLFADVRNTIEAQDNDFAAEVDSNNVEAFQTQVIQEAGQFKIIQPADTIIIIEIFEINLELYFSEFPFVEIKTFTSVKPSIVKEIDPSKETKENIIKRSDYANLKDATVEITEIKEGLPPKKVTTFWWTNSDIKVKVNEDQGTLQVYFNKKRVPGCYVKVFSDKGFNKDFYRDGYTDMTGTFRYAMSDLDGIKEFSILVMTDKGGVIQKVKPPSKLASF